jgi:hypothetical protein
MRGRLRLAKDCIAFCGQSAHEPIRFDRIPEPRLRPAVGHAGLNRAWRYFPAIGIEQRQLAAWLRQAAL